jgi:hypothetical protein
MNRIYNRMQELEIFLEPLVTETEAWVLGSTTTSPVDPGEAVLARSLRCMARIKLNRFNYPFPPCEVRGIMTLTLWFSARIKVHRYCAFFDLPVFSGKHCDLKPRTRGDDQSQEPRMWPSCSCSSLLPTPSSDTGCSASPSVVSAGSASSPASDTSRIFNAAPSHGFPFSNHQSAKICLRSALNISKSFENLPYPNPYGQACDPPCFLSPTSSIIAPRTMPSFACCAMQCAYALLMVHHKTKSLYPENSPSGPLVGSLLARLQQGLVSISATLENYATAFEALGGMRGKSSLSEFPNCPRCKR